MKQLLIFLLCVCTLYVKAEKPYGHYIAKYIITKDYNNFNYHPIYNPLTISHTGILVRNTNAGDKCWKTEYLGPYNKKLGRTIEVFHKFYLTNQYVYFFISDRPFFRYKNTYFYVIRFDGQIQLATVRN